MARGWSQQQLADRSGLSRAGVSAIEARRLAPSVTAALALSDALETTVEDLFGRTAGPQPTIDWAFPPSTTTPRYWRARVGDRILWYPVGEDSPQLDWHDGALRAGVLQPSATDAADRTLVVAGCDPAAGLLAAEFARQFQFRMIVVRRSSRAALDLLAEGKVHAAGIHFGQAGHGSQNGRAARSRLGAGCTLVRVARWEEGLALGPRLKAATVRNLLKSKAHWVGREDGSGARSARTRSWPASLRRAASPTIIAAWPTRCVAAGPTWARVFV